ncbi:MAG: DEAD/DEAH box helicase [Rubrivivax sp.]|nr:MAG: DEAD/DEAH box helicase [Rubrivivax sp.]
MTDFALPDDFDLGEYFDGRTLARAVDLKPEQAIQSMQVIGPVLSTRLHGSGAQAYAQRTELVNDRRLGLRVVGHCTCPVGLNCKHVAAALIAFEAQQVRKQRGGGVSDDSIAKPAPAPVKAVAPAPDLPVVSLGALPLIPVLKLSTCVDVVSEAMLHHRYGSQSSINTKIRQAAAQLVFRYQPEGAEPVDFHFPAVQGAQGFAERDDPEQPGQRQTARFERQSKQEATALLDLCNTLEFRSWSLSAGLAINRLTRLNAGGAGSNLEGDPLILVPQKREQWPNILTMQLPLLKSRGWVIEVKHDFPYELHTADEWTVDVDEEAGGDWFSVGLKVTVEGQRIDLLPLLVGLVQTGWLKLNAEVRDGQPRGDVLVPWPDNTPPEPGAPPRQRLLRIPVQRVAPLMEWMRSVFASNGKDSGPLRLSRFDLGTLEAVTAQSTVVAPPSFTNLIEQVRLLGSGRSLPAVAPSPNVQATLRHYQLDGLAWMDFLRRARLGGVLADDMGLGKTLQTLTLLQGELDAGRLDRPSLVVVPTSLITNWQTEAQRFTPGLKLVVLHGPQRMQYFKRIEHAHLVITSYPLAVRDIDTLAAQEWHYLLLDEAQRIKNSRSQATLSLKGLRARHRLCLSGTPLENHLGELWSLMDFVCPGLLGSEAQFREHYRNPIEKRKDTLQAEHLARRVRPFILRRTKLQVARELPEKTETHLRVDLTGTQRDLYETVRATMDKKLREAIEKQGLARSQIMVLDALLKLRQVCCDPRLLKMGPDGAPAAGKAAPSAKMALLLDLLPTLVEDGRRILLFSQFTEMLSLIEAEMIRLKIDYLKLTGETHDRASLVDKFQKGQVPLFLISLKAGGTGLNLTAADTVILYDPWWNPAVEQQAIDRAYRIGQDKPVFVYKLLANGTVEDKMVELQARKAGLADLLLSGVASDAALNAQDFDELFKPLVPEESTP